MAGKISSISDGKVRMGREIFNENTINGFSLNDNAGQILSIDITHD